MATDRLWDGDRLVAEYNSSGTLTPAICTAPGPTNLWPRPSAPAVPLWHYKAITYDPRIGRFLQTDPTQAAFEWLPTAAQALAYARTYGTPTNLNQVTSQTQGGTTLSVAWNTNGNMTSDGINTFTWTFGNRMSGATGPFGTASYAYDADNCRTRKTVNGTTTRYLWSGSDELGDYNASGGLIRRFVPTSNPRRVFIAPHAPTT